MAPTITVNQNYGRSQQAPLHGPAPTVWNNWKWFLKTITTTISLTLLQPLGKWLPHFNMYFQWTWTCTNTDIYHKQYNTTNQLGSMVTTENLSMGKQLEATRFLALVAVRMTGLRQSSAEDNKARARPERLIVYGEFRSLVNSKEQQNCRDKLR